MLEINDTQLVIIDIQGKLSQIVYQAEELVSNVKKLIQFAKLKEIPIVWVEQNPQGLGDTHGEIAALLTEQKPISKMNFSAFGEVLFRDTVLRNNCNQVVLVGIEAHVCVCQTALDLIDNGYEVFLITDAVSSRTPENKQAGIDRIKSAGGKTGSTEMILFELQRTCDDPDFKKVLQLVK